MTGNWTGGVFVPFGIAVLPSGASVVLARGAESPFAAPFRAGAFQLPVGGPLPLFAALSSAVPASSARFACASFVPRDESHLRNHLRKQEACMSRRRRRRLTRILEG